MSVRIQQNCYTHLLSGIGPCLGYRPKEQTRRDQNSHTPAFMYALHRLRGLTTAICAELIPAGSLKEVVIIRKVKQEVQVPIKVTGMGWASVSRFQNHVSIQGLLSEEGEIVHISARLFFPGSIHQTAVGLYGV